MGSKAGATSSLPRTHSNRIGLVRAMVGDERDGTIEVEGVRIARDIVMERENSRRPPDPRSFGVGPRIRKQQSHRNGVGLKFPSRRCPAGCRECVLLDNIKIAVSRMPEQAADADHRLAWRHRLPREPATRLRLAAKRAVAHRTERIE